MIDTGKQIEATYENPLIPNAKLRQIYLAMLRARLLGKALAKRRRGDSALELEACLVSTAVDLGPSDLISDALTGGAVDFLRGSAFVWLDGTTEQRLRRVTLESALHTEKSARSGDLKADCGGAVRLARAAATPERLWAALGAAAALKAQHGQAKTDRNAAAVYVRLGEVPPATWRKALAFATEQQLPVLFVVLPAAKNGSKTPPVGAMSALASRHGVPGMAVDACDAVAIYRVAQEALGRIRIGGGAVLMECVPFVLEGKTAADAIAGLEQYMLSRGVVNRRWMEREAESCARRIAK